VRVVWTETALQAVWRVYGYLTEFNPRAAVHLAESLLEAEDMMRRAETPSRGCRDHPASSDGRSQREHLPCPSDGRAGPPLARRRSLTCGG